MMYLCLYSIPKVLLYCITNQNPVNWVLFSIWGDVMKCVNTHDWTQIFIIQEFSLSQLEVSLSTETNLFD